MTTKLISRFVKVAALSGVVGVGCMQAEVQARFHLPVATHLGSTVLAAGDYRIYLPNSLSGAHQITVEGHGRKIYQFVMAINPDSKVSNPSLRLVERNGSYYVKEFRSGLEGAIYTFQVPKAMGDEHSQTIDSTR